MSEFVRNFRRQWVVGLLNICSLSLGVMVSLTVGLWALGELTFDGFHRGADRMYRVTLEGEIGGRMQRAPVTHFPFGPAAADMEPRIEKMTRVLVLENEGVLVDNTVRFNNRLLAVDNNFFDFFTFPLKYGDPATALSGPSGIILTESSAARYFPRTDPMGRILRIHGQDFTVTGVMRDFPHNSHLQGDMVVPFFRDYAQYGWNEFPDYNTYFSIMPDTDLRPVEERLTRLNNDNSVTLGKLGGRIRLEPVREVHFTPATHDKALKGDRRMLVTFIVIAALILVISCINFANLFVSTTFIRAKAIGIRKSLGASKAGLALGFYRETLVYVLIAAVAGLGLTLLCLPVFNAYSGSSLSVEFSSPRLYLLLASIVLLTVLMAGTFPAFQLTRTGITATLRGRFRTKRMSLFQRVLVVFQFASSIFLLLAVAFFGRQIDLLLSRDLGFDKENVISVKGWGSFGADYRLLRDALLMGEPSILDITMRQYSLPFDLGEGANVWTSEMPETVWFALDRVAPNYFDFMGVGFVDGENPFLLESSRAMRYCVLNETGVRALGLADPVGQTLYIETGSTVGRDGGNDFIVRGVVADARFASLHNPVEPRVFIDIDRESDNPILFRVAGDPGRAIRAIGEKWKEMEPNVTFEYKILEEEYEKLYSTEKNARGILLYALLVTLVITVSGLFATTYYSAQRRTREIAIRKINGATSHGILLLLNGEVMRLVAFGFVIAVPAAWAFIDRWLSGFDARTPLEWYVFLGAAAVACVIALATVSYQAWRAASANPVDSLKSNG